MTRIRRRTSVLSVVQCIGLLCRLVWRRMSADPLLRHSTPPRSSFAIKHDRKKQFFKRGRRMFDAEQLAVITRDSLLDLLNALIRQTLCPNLRDVGQREQTIDAAQLFELALVQD